MGPHTIDRRWGNDHSPPPESGDSVDRIDMARRNFENDPADVRAAVPRELKDREESVDVVRSVRGALRRSLGDRVAFVSLDVEVMVVLMGLRASSKSEPVLFRALR